MNGQHVELLIQSWQECCEEISACHVEIRKLNERESFSKFQFWVSGIEDALGNASEDLRKWYTKFTKRKQGHYGRSIKELNDTSELSDWIKELANHIKGLVRDACGEELDPHQSVSTLQEIELDIKAINRLITNIKDFEKAGTNENNAIKEIVKQEVKRIESLRVLFEDRIRTLLPQQREGSFCILGERGCLYFEQMDWFWSKIPRPPNIPRQRDPNNTYDGEIINSAHIDKAKAYLQLFIEAWLAINGEPVDRESLDIMQHMPKIACVLHAAGKEALFNKFIAAEIRDSALDEDWDTFFAKVEDALKDRSMAREIVAQFSRVKAKPWPDGSHLKLEWSEPLPLREISELRQSKGSVRVYEVEDVWEPSQHYALKVVNTKTAVTAQLNDLRNEITGLMTIGREDHGHHIVKFVKSFERGSSSEMGMLMLPVASFDLNKFLNRCCQETDLRQKHRQHLIQAPGCLAYSLAYLHNIQEMRHRDVKPHNILVHKASESAPPEFLWADFGLAFVFREQGFSGDRNPNFGATPEYEAPEIDPEQEGLHTRAADVFALGCVFLEIIWVLVLNPHIAKDQNGLRADFWEPSKRLYYKHHLPGLNQWISKTEAKLKEPSQKFAKVVLGLAKKMILRDTEQRIKIGDVVKELWAFKSNGPTEKLFCDRCTNKMRIDTSRTPLHPGIFKHKRRDSNNVRRISALTIHN